MNKEERRPTAPPGFQLFKWKTKDMGDYRAQLCPVCGEIGTVWKGGGFDDPGAQAVVDRFRAEGANVTMAQYKGKRLLDHWSRWGRGNCMKCGCEFWNDFGGEAREWHYYFNPATSRSTKAYQTAML